MTNPPLRLIVQIQVALSFLMYPAFGCVEPADNPSRIALAGGSLTEILYFLGEQNRIVAVDSTSNFPQEATEFPSVGYVRNLSAEGLLSLDPTLILGEHDMGPPEVLDQVSSAGVQTVRVPEEFTPEGIVEKVRCVIRVLGLDENRTAGQISTLIKTIHTLERPIENKGAPLKVAFLLGIQDSGPLGAGTNTSADGLLEMVGVENAFKDFEGWKPVSPESMAIANPDYIVIPTRGAKSAGGIDGIVQHPVIRLTKAGQRRQIIIRDGMEMLGFGPRTLYSAEEIAKTMSISRISD